tara:strand:+ start:151 stop:324 length:174 start_codon:yes stop_codon:yes gene_type:complete
VTNEEQDLLDKFPDHQVNLASVVERDKIVIENLIRKSLITKINNNGVIFVKKNKAAA